MAEVGCPGGQGFSCLDKTRLRLLKTLFFFDAHLPGFAPERAHVLTKG
jgi:hypothetical protein